MPDKSSKETKIQIDPITGFIQENPERNYASPPGAESLEQVREILVGPFNKDFDHRLSDLACRIDMIQHELQRLSSAIEIELVDRNSLSGMLSEMAARFSGPADDSTVDPTVTEDDLEKLLGDSTDGPLSA